MSNRFVKALLVAILIPFISSCAFGTRRPILNYTPVTPESSPKGIAIHVASFKDDRFDKDLVGHMRNGYGMRTAKVVTETNISDWATNALKAELTRAGYTVTDEVSSVVSVNGEVLHVFCDAFFMYEGKVELDIALDKQGQQIMREKYRGTFQDVNIAGTSKSYALTLEKSLQNALRDAVKDIEKRLAS